MPIEKRSAITLTCEKCQGAAEPAAQMRTFEYEGQILSCLALVSSCVICGHRWEDDAYAAQNSLFAEQAREAVLNRLQYTRDVQACIVRKDQDLNDFVQSHEFVNPSISD